MLTETLSIGGMTCAACSARVEKAIRKLEGVENAAVNIATEKAVVTYNAETLTVSAIKEAVEKAGYEVREKSKGSTVTIPIGGMTCAACSTRVEKAIGKLEGIESVTVNIATEKAVVVYDTRALRLSAIKEAIIKAGYQALEVSKDACYPAGSLDEDKLRKEKEIKTLRVKFIVAASLGLPLL